MIGYAQAEYAASLSEFGTPRALPECGGWVLEREIPGSGQHDAMGCYPLFACRDWSRLRADLDEMKDLVSVALVTDPFGDYDVGCLENCFDVIVPFKEHFVADLSLPLNSIVSSHHRQYSRRYSREVEVEVCAQPAQHCDEWFDFYSCLIERHKITGIRAFSKEVFARQMSMPGIVVLTAQAHGRSIGGQLWLVQDDVAYSHLTACSEAGYAQGAAYAMNWFAVDYFKDKVRWLDIGAGPGLKGGSGGGLVQFKRGWASGTRTVYFCGRVLNPEQYSKIVSASHVPQTDYFPAYRLGEFQETDE